MNHKKYWESTRVKGAYRQGRKDAIEEVKREFTEIIQGNEEFIDWQKEEILLCLECAIENIKEQSNDR